MSQPTIHALLVYPEFAISRWGFQHAIGFIGKKAFMPPLGLLTVAALFPAHYAIRVIDMNVAALTDDDLRWADVVFTSSMIVQRRSLHEVIARCRAAARPIVAGGPYPTACPDELAGVDHVIAGEAEGVFPGFLSDLEAGRARPLYRESGKPDVTRTPLPRYDLVDIHAYYYLSAQFSRGCPFTCEFCDIPMLFGRVPRTKTNGQMLAELSQLHRLGWRGPVFIADDNFIANKRDAMRLLPALAAWQRARRHPFAFLTEASVNLAQVEPLLDAMVEAGFHRVFLGIETPNPAALNKLKKVQNVSRGRAGARAQDRSASSDTYLLDAVRTIQAKGIEVAAGFILGLDSDGPEVFDAQIEFVQATGIPMAAVGLLTALRGTPLYDRLAREHRLLKTGQTNIDMLEISPNFEPEMERSALLEGYARALTTLYDPGLVSYFERCATLVRWLKPTRQQRMRIGTAELGALLESMRRQLCSEQGPAYLRCMLRTALRHPTLLPKMVELAIIGYHLEKMASGTVAAMEFREAIRRARERFEQGVRGPASRTDAGALRREARATLSSLGAQYRRIPDDFQPLVREEWDWFAAFLMSSIGDLEGLTQAHGSVAAFQRPFSGLAWDAHTARLGYRRLPFPLVEQPLRPAGAPGAALSVAIAPTVAGPALAYALESFFRALGADVFPLVEQVRGLRQRAGHGGDLGDLEAGQLVASYLDSLGERVDYVIVPVADAQERAAGAAGDGASQRLYEGRAPRVIWFRHRDGTSDLRECLSAIGALLTDDQRRIERCCDQHVDRP
jgi:radical SAM superfamily enzyme YgiQ (UPF0313 family)